MKWGNKKGGNNKSVRLHYQTHLVGAQSTHFGISPALTKSLLNKKDHTLFVNQPPSSANNETKIILRETEKNKFHEAVENHRKYIQKRSIRVGSS